MNFAVDANLGEVLEFKRTDTAQTWSLWYSFWNGMGTGQKITEYYKLHACCFTEKKFKEDKVELLCNLYISTI